MKAKGTAAVELRSQDDCAIWIVIINYHGLEDTLECLESIKKSDARLNQVVVVDNASEASQPKAIAQAYPEIHLHRNSENQGWAGGNNRGIEIALQHGAKWVLLLNNDTIVAPDIMGRMRAACESNMWDVVGPLIHEYSDRDRVQSEGIAFNRTNNTSFFSLIPVSQLAKHPQDVVATDIVNGCAVAVSARVFEAIGLIDEKFFLICEETDFCLRAKESGFRLGVLAQPLVWHKHSVSFARAGKPLQRYYGTRNLRLLLAKHGRHAEQMGYRTSFQSSIAFYQYTYHLFAHECELNNPDGACAVITGLVDSWLGRYGKQRKPISWLVNITNAAFWGVWKMRGGRVHTNQSAPVT